MVRRIEVCPGVLPGAEIVPVPSRAPVVVPTDLLESERCGLPEFGWEFEDRCLVGERDGEVDDLDAAGSKRGDEVRQVGHCVTPMGEGAADTHHYDVSFAPVHEA